MLFENMGITYLGPVDGHDIQAVKRAILDAKRINHAVIVHVVTKKERAIRRRSVIHPNIMA